MAGVETGELAERMMDVIREQTVWTLRMIADEVEKLREDVTPAMISMAVRAIASGFDERRERLRLVAEPERQDEDNGA